MKTYFRLTLFCTFALIASVAAFNWLVNPYLVFNTPVIKGINQFVTENYYKQLLFKPYQLRHTAPRSVIIGASRAGIAFNPEQLPAPAYNLAVGGASAYINHRLLQEALAGDRTPEHVVLETPFFAFNALDPNNTPGHDPEFERRLRTHDDNSPNHELFYYMAHDILSSLTAWDTTRASLRTLAKQEKLAARKRNSFIQLRNGQWLQQAPANASSIQPFEASWKKFLHNEWFPAPAHRFALQDEHDHSPLEYYRQSLALLYAQRVHADIVIAPVHASLLLALREAGLWSDFETWEAALIRINEEEAARSGQVAFTIHDHAAINEYTAETVSRDKPATDMQWFYDASHSTPALGQLVLADVLSAEPRAAMQSFRLAEFAATRRQQLDRYAAQHPQQLESIRQLVNAAPFSR